MGRDAAGPWIRVSCSPLHPVRACYRAVSHLVDFKGQMDDVAYDVRRRLRKKHFLVSADAQSWHGHVAPSGYLLVYWASAATNASATWHSTPRHSTPP